MISEDTFSLRQLSPTYKREYVLAVTTVCVYISVCNLIAVLPRERTFRLCRWHSVAFRAAGPKSQVEHPEHIQRPIDSNASMVIASQNGKFDVFHPVRKFY